MAQVKPGDMITADNAAKVKDLISPGVYYKVKAGMTMNIVPSERVEWPPPYREATEKYSEQVRLSPDGRTIQNYVSGQPFPFLDVNDPNVATKIIWNNVFRPITTDDYDLRYFSCDNEYEGHNRPLRVIDRIDVGHYAGYNEIGRTEVDPIADRSGLQNHPSLLAVRAVPDNVAGKYARHRVCFGWRSGPASGDSSWTETPRVATRKPAPGPRSIGPSRTFALRTMERWGEATAPTTSPRSSPNCWRTRCGTRCRAHEEARAVAPWPIRLGLLHAGPFVVCAVADPSPQAPAPRQPDHLDESGRGLMVVDSLSDQWAFCTAPAALGKVVWAAFAATAEPG